MRLLLISTLFFSVVPLSYSCDQEFRKEIKSYSEKLEGLNYHKVYRDSERNLERLLYNYKSVRMPRPVIPIEKPRALHIRKIHFMQRSCEYRSEDQNGGYTVVDNARSLKNKKLLVDDLPTITVWIDEDRKVWTLNHRRLAAMLLSGVVKDVPVIWAMPDEVLRENNIDKFYPKNGGTQIEIVDLQSNISVIVRH